MTASIDKRVRCAVYTRVSTDAGLDQEFNSLDAQHDAAEAYICSQAHAGWTLVRTRYDDGGFSGGSTDRPALQRLIADIKANRVNVIVVYKVDRLTRSLADFAKLVELFDANGATFVSVTQQFNTTTSMGRLTLNVLLSFAQFEREVTSERIRDKIGASKRKGLWVGGPLPLGYELKEGHVVVIPEEAERVKIIFQRYLKASGVNALAMDLRRSNIVTKQRSLSTGKISGGIPFGRGSLFYLLRNRFYVGEVSYKGEILAGPQPPILDRTLFDQVQAKLTERWSHRTAFKIKSSPLLAGLLFDDAGLRMILTHATKNRVRYRYYVSEPHLHGQSKTARVGTVSRLPADDLEAVIVKAICEHFRINKVDDSGQARDLIIPRVARIEVQKNQLIVICRSGQMKPAVDADGDSSPDDQAECETLLIPYRKPPGKRFREILLPPNTARKEVRPIKAERRAKLIAAISRGRRWLNEIVTGQSLSADDIAVREKCSVRHVNMTISLSFLAPGLVKAAIEGRLPRGIGVERLRDLPSEWSRQFETLGLLPE